MAACLACTPIVDNDRIFDSTAQARALQEMSRNDSMDDDSGRERSAGNDQRDLTTGQVWLNLIAADSHGKTSCDMSLESRTTIGITEYANMALNPDAVGARRCLFKGPLRFGPGR